MNVSVVSHLVSVVLLQTPPCTTDIVLGQSRYVPHCQSHLQHWYLQDTFPEISNCGGQFLIAFGGHLLSRSTEHNKESRRVMQKKIKKQRESDRFLEEVWHLFQYSVQTIYLHALEQYNKSIFHHTF